MKSRILKCNVGNVNEKLKVGLIYILTGYMK